MYMCLDKPLNRHLTSLDPNPKTLAGENPIQYLDGARIFVKERQISRMGTCMSLDAPVAQPEEEAARRYECIYGVQLPKKLFIAGDTTSEPFNVTVNMDGHKSEHSVVSDEPAFMLKKRLHEAPPEGLIVAPPGVSRIMLGDIEILDIDTWGDHGVQRGAQLSLLFETAITIEMGFSTRCDRKCGLHENTEVLEIRNFTKYQVWAEEKVQAMLHRLDMGSSSDWVIIDSSGRCTASLEQSANSTCGAAGLMEGTVIEMYNTAPNQIHGFVTAENYELSFEIQIHNHVRCFVH